MYPKFKNNKNFQLLVIGREHTDEELKVYNNKKKFTFPLYPDAKREVASLFATKYIPRTYLIDKTGKVVSTTQGFNQGDFNEMMTKIDNLLK